ncbi:MAG: tetratricopeptide repeat protein [Pseudomonadota bacterium]
MARKRKKNRKSRAGSANLPVNLSLEELEAQGGKHLRAGKYREAVTAFKRMLQQENRPEWLESLAEAYAGRAQGLADKGMFKEAAVIWRNRAESCHRFLAEPAYIELLLQTGQIESALQLIQQQRRQIEERGYLPRLRILCAVQVLAGEEAFLNLFAKDDPLRRDFPVAQAALRAYCSGQDVEMEQQLKAIPFRSPFRDFRQILNALSLLEIDASGAYGLLDRVDAGSPFHVLCTAIRASQSPAPDFLRDYQNMGKAERRFATALKGWSAEQLRLAQELRQLGDRPSTDRLLRFLLRNKEILGDEYVRESAMRILVFHPQGEAVFNKSLGQLSPFHRERIASLRLEEDGPPHEVFNSWYDACVRLDQPEVCQDPEVALTLALIKRRMTRQWLRSQPANRPVFAALERALQLDPEDQPSYLELIRLYREEDKLKDARRLLDQALSRYPEDAEVLTEAVETAIASSAFKKAARYARRTLELDPINPKVRDILLHSHLAHARKQVQQKKLMLARKELEEAANWARTEQALGRIDLAQAILELSDGNREEAHRCFLSGFERTGGGLAGRFQLLMEAGRMQRHMATVLKQAQLPKLPRQVTRDQVLALIHALSEADENEGMLIEALEFLETPLKSAAKLDFSQPEMERLCETWLRLEQQDLRTRYARAALKRWPDTPVFVFHQIDASQEMFIDLSTRDRRQLESAYQSARADGDMRTVHRIGELLDAGLPFMEPDDAPFDSFGFEESSESLPEGEELEHIIDMLMKGSGPPEVEEMKRELGPEGARRLLREILGGNFDPGRLDDILGGLAQPKARKQPRKKLTIDDPDQFELF